MLLALSIGFNSVALSKTDSFGWLEEQSEQTEAWVSKNNKAVTTELVNTEGFQRYYENVLKHREVGGSLPYPRIIGEHVYNVYRDASNQLGLLRRTTQESYLSGDPKWEPVLNIDALSKQEGKKFQYKGIACLLPDHQRCLIGLAEGGTSDSTIREFDAVNKVFVDDGFSFPDGWIEIEWLNKETLYFGSTHTPESTTDSHYPSEIKLWKRGTPLESAKLVKKVTPDQLGLFLNKYYDGKDHIVLTHYETFHNKRHFLLKGDQSFSIDLPGSVELYGVFDHSLVIKLAQKYKNFAANSIVLVDMESIYKGNLKVSLITEEQAGFPIEAVSVTKNSILVNKLVHVQSEATLFLKDAENNLVQKAIPLPANGSFSVSQTDYGQDKYYINYENYLQPDTLYLLDALTQETTSLYAKNSAIDKDDYVSIQYFATSKDGTKIPYFVMHKKGMELNGKNPTVLKSYGGFNISITPSYISSITSWIETGAVYVFANIRGGGEYGKSWHEAGIKGNKVKSFEDFEAVAEDLVKRKITSPNYLGAYGASNGGLLAATVSTRRPDLFKAAVAGSPFTDMLKYTKFRGGKAYLAEYGDPDNERDLKFLKTYSPYHNIPTDSMPAMLFITATKDRHVHPAHARKMAARLQEMGHKATFYEKSDGGHQAAIGFKDVAFRDALIHYFVLDNLKK